MTDLNYELDQGAWEANLSQYLDHKKYLTKSQRLEWANVHNLRRQDYLRIRAYFNREFGQSCGAEVDIFGHQFWKLVPRPSTKALTFWSNCLAMCVDNVLQAACIGQLVDAGVEYDPAQILKVFESTNSDSLRLIIGDELARSKPINPCPRMLELVNDESIDQVHRQYLFRPIRKHCGKATARRIMLEQPDPESMFWLGEFAYVIEDESDVELMRKALLFKNGELLAFAKRKIASAGKRLAKLQAKK